MLQMLENHGRRVPRPSRPADTIQTGPISDTIVHYDESRQTGSRRTRPRTNAVNSSVMETKMYSWNRLRIRSQK